MEEGEDDVKSAWPLWVGLHTCYNENYKKLLSIQVILLIFKNFRSSNYKLQLAYMKVESLVIANQNVAVNLYLGLVHTARHMQRVSFA